ncbi:unnamed protein product [Closterium sp. NIES-54]
MTILLLHPCVKCNLAFTLPTTCMGTYSSSLLADAEQLGVEQQGAGLEAPTLGAPVTGGRRRTGLVDQARLPGRPGYLGDMCEGRRGDFCEADLGGGISRSTWLVGAVAGVDSAERQRCAHDEEWRTNQLLTSAKQVHRCPAGATLLRGGCYSSPHRLATHSLSLPFRSRAVPSLPVRSLPFFSLPVLSRPFPSLSVPSRPFPCLCLSPFLPLTLLFPSLPFASLSCRCMTQVPPAPVCPCLCASVSSHYSFFFPSHSRPFWSLRLPRLQMYDPGAAGPRLPMPGTVSNVKRKASTTPAWQQAAAARAAEKESKRVRMSRDVVEAKLFALFEERPHWTLKHLTDATQQPQGYRSWVEVRMSQDVVEAKLFALFEERPHWTLKHLTDATQQPQQFLKEVLGDMCVYNKRGPNQGLYELKPEYKHAAQPAS